jgi:hypothetical protein
MFRVCAGCNKKLSPDEYSNNQWRKPVGISRCSLCIQENIDRSGEGFGTMRSNERSHKAVFDWDHVYATGSFREVVLGRYTGGPRTGQKAVAKYFKYKYHHISDSFFQTDEAAVQKALHIITSFNGAGYINSKIRLNVPERWLNKNDHKFMFVEPFIENFEKFNSNSGWVSRNSGSWYDVLQALSHYSYHISSGQYTLCDLQGGIYRDGVILTDPVVHSRRRVFGPTDLGPQGMSSFFARHRCNRYCRSNWTRPRDTNIYHKETSGTSMEYGHTPSQRDSYLPSMSGIDEDSDYSDSDSY